MKAERKIEVETNELADTLTKIGDWVQQNTAPIALLIGAAVVGGVAYSLIFAEKPIDAPAGDWNKYMLALSDEQPEKELQMLVDELPDASSPVAVQAKLALGSMQLAEASRLQFEDRKTSAEMMEKAQKNLEAVESSATADTYTRNRARMGLAAILETQNKPKEAQEYYEKVSKSGSPENAYAKLAAGDFKRLESKANQDFISWFAKQEPVQRRNPHAGFPFDGQAPLPETKDFSLPTLPPSDSGIGKPLIPGLTIPEKTEATEKTPETETKSETPQPEKTETPAEKSETPKSEAAKTETSEATPPATEKTETAPETK
jgi:hypothetical protein